MKIIQQISKLREHGYMVRVSHYRFTQRGLFSSRVIQIDNNSARAELRHHIKPCGGKVIVEITSPQNETFTGASYCSEQDNFKRTIGTTMALGRAIKQLRPGWENTPQKES